jgi:hypothetical protein
MSLVTIHADDRGPGEIADLEAAVKQADERERAEREGTQRKDGDR